MLLKKLIVFAGLLKKSTLYYSKKTDNFFLKKLKGGALYIAILVSIIIGVILCMFILIANYNQRTVTEYTQFSQLNYNLKSAFELAQSDYFTPEKNNQWLKNTYNDDSLKIKKIYWGAYLLITAQTKNRHHALSQAGIYGTSMPADTGLLISDNSRPVGLGGQISFKANCYLPKAGIKPAFIEGQSFINAPQNAGFTKVSPMAIPAPVKDLIDGIKQQQAGINIYIDSVVSFLPQTITQSFIAKTLVWEAGSVKLSNLNLKNNIKIIANNIEVENNCNLENILIICNKIKFKDGFKGKVHIIASDSILTEKNCEFTYPSSFVLLPAKDESTALKYIELSDDCKFFGGIVALNETDNNPNVKVFIKLAAKSEINGFIYSANYLHLQGQVNATVICDKLLLKTPSAVYENHMLGCEIDPKKYAHVLAIPSVLNKTSKLICCQKIN